MPFGVRLLEKKKELRSQRSIDMNDYNFDNQVFLLPVLNEFLHYEKDIHKIDISQFRQIIAAYLENLLVGVDAKIGNNYFFFDISEAKQLKFEFDSESFPQEALLLLSYKDKEKLSSQQSNSF